MLGLSALVLILAEGGLTTSWAHARAAAPAALSLATVGVVVSVLVVAAAARWLVGLGWRDALLLGAVLAPTDAAAVFSVLRKLPLPPRLSGTLEGESGLNDPPAVLAVTLLSEVGHHAPSAALIAGEVVYELAAGAAIGLLAGAAGRAGPAARRAAGLGPVPDRDPGAHRGRLRGGDAGPRERVPGRVRVRAGPGQRPAPARPGHPRLRRGRRLAGPDRPVRDARAARLPRPGCPRRSSRPWSPGSVLVLVARPAAVPRRTLPLRVPWRQQAFMSWAGLRGAVPIVLATIPMNARVPGATRLFDIVFIIVVINTLAQGPTLPWAARRLKVTAPAEPLDVDVEAAPLEALHADLLQAQIPPGSRLHGVEIFELRLPAQANIALIVRDETGIRPHPHHQPARPVTGCSSSPPPPCGNRPNAGCARSAGPGKLAGWFGEHGL